MHTRDIEYRADGARLVGQYVVDDGKPGKRAGVLVCHEGPGLTEHTKKIAARLAGLGYAAFAMDYHGDGKPLANLADARPRIAAWIADPTGIRARATAALDVLKSQNEVDATRLAAIGYCFGGTTSLELGRAGWTSRPSSASIPVSPPRGRRMLPTSRARCWSASAPTIPSSRPSSASTSKRR